MFDDPHDHMDVEPDIVEGDDHDLDAVENVPTNFDESLHPRNGSIAAVSHETSPFAVLTPEA
jgi:hypothetical protein